MPTNHAGPILFPQSKASQRKGKPSIGQILDENLGCQPMAAVMRLVKELHTTANIEEVRTALDQFIEAERNEHTRVKAEIETMESIEEVAGDGPEDEALIDTLNRRSAAGDSRAEALARMFDAPRLRLQDAIMDLAVEADPYWRKTGDGRYSAKRGATHQTPEALTAAYMKAQGPSLVQSLPPDLRKLWPAL